METTIMENNTADTEATSATVMEIQSLYKQVESREDWVSIGDVSRIVGVPTHTIRYWEKEFPAFLEPPRTVGKQRRYGNDQIAKIQKIMSMLKEDGYSIAGARRALAVQNKESVIPSTEKNIDQGTAERIINLLKDHLSQIQTPAMS